MHAADAGNEREMVVGASPGAAAPRPPANGPVLHRLWIVRCEDGGAPQGERRQQLASHDAHVGVVGGGAVGSRRKATVLARCDHPEPLGPQMLDLFEEV